MSGTSMSGGSYVVPNKVPSDWRIVGAADMNADGQADLVWRQQTTGDLYVWFMGPGTTATAGTSLSPSRVPPSWTISAIGDFNGDDRADLVWQNLTTGHLYIWFMNGVQLQAGQYLSPAVVDPAWKIVAVK
jgi:hypothetical protein